MYEAGRTGALPLQPVDDGRGGLEPGHAGLRSQRRELDLRARFERGVDPAFVETMGIRLLAGRNFSESRAADDATFPKETDLAFEQSLARRGMNVIINDRASRQLGFASPQDAIGKRIGLSLVSDPDRPGESLRVAAPEAPQECCQCPLRGPADPVMGGVVVEVVFGAALEVAV